MKLGFSGHRNCRTLWRDLDRLNDDWPGAEWVWGDALDGFDAQVKLYIVIHQLPHTSLPAGVNPKLRNTDIIASGIDALVVCHDGREYGGTWDTICKAKARHIPIIRLTCIPITQPYKPVRK